jgi:outer membrane protein assembly factor BamB
MTSDPNQIQSRPRRRPKVMLYWSLCVIALFVLVRWFGPSLSLSTGIGTDIFNVVALVLMIVTWLAWLVWGLFRAGGTWRYRLGVTSLIAGSVLLFFALFELETTGDMKITNIRWRKYRSPVFETQVVKAETVDLQSDSATNFPGFLGRNRDGKIEGAQFESDWSKSPPQELWKIKVGDGWSGVAIANGFLVTMEQRGPEECVACYRLDDGAQVWIYQNPQRHDDRGNMGYAGPRSTPTIFGGRVYCQGATGTLMCLEGATGELIWKKEVDEVLGISYGSSTALLTGEKFRQEPGLSWGRSISPLIEGDMVITGGGADHREGQATSNRFVTLLGFHKDTGELVWEAGDDMIAYGSPNVGVLAGKRQIVITAENHSLGIDPGTGKTLWKIPFSGSSSGDANTSQTTFVDESHVLLSKGYGRGGKLYEIIEKGGSFQTREVWSNSRVLRTKLTNPVIRDGYAYALSDGFIECVEVMSGDLKWKERAHAGNGQMLIVGDHLLVHSEHGKLMIAPVSPQEFRKLGEINTVAGICWNTLAVSGPYVVVRSNLEMACFRLSTSTQVPVSESP